MPRRDGAPGELSPPGAPIKSFYSSKVEHGTVNVGVRLRIILEAGGASIPYIVSKLLYIVLIYIF